VKKAGLILGLAMVSLFLVAGIARADSDFTAKIVDGDLSSTEKYSFGLGQVPWLWAHKSNVDPTEILHYLYTTWYIVKPDMSLDYKGYSMNTPPAGTDMWNTLGGYDWSTITGSTENWQAVSTLTSIHPAQFDPNSLKFECSDCSSTTKCVTFTRYVPEPISSSLFLLGVGAFGLKMFRKKKKV